MIKTKVLQQMEKWHIKYRQTNVRLITYLSLENYISQKIKIVFKSEDEQ